MSESDDSRKRTSRRRFIKWTGVLAGLALVSAVAGAAASGILERNATLETDISAETITANPLTTTVTKTETAMSTQDVNVTEDHLLTSTETKTATLTRTVSRTVTETTTLSQSTAVTSLPTGPQAPFSIFWITDTQFLSEMNPALFGETTNWIVNQWGPYNGKLVIHTGDIVQTGAHKTEWANANNAMSVFLQNGIPYTWCAGNHDDFVGSDTTSGWIGNTNAAAFDPVFVSNQVNLAQNAAWVGDYHDGTNTAIAFTANGLNFLVINLEWNAQPDTMKWAGGILDDPTYKDYHAIVAAHVYVNALGFALDYTNHVDLTTFINGLKSLIDSHSNVFLTLNGHYATECGYNSSSPINSRNELMFDRQDCTDAPNSLLGRGLDPTATVSDSLRVGGSTVTILTCDTVNNRVDVRTYDVNTGEWRTDEYEQYSFAMFPALSSATSVKSSSNAHA